MIPPARILAAVDFSEPSRIALGFAARMARTTGAVLHVLHAEDPLLAAAAHTRGLDLSTELRSELRMFTAGTWPALEHETSFHVMTGDAVETVLDVAHREHADLVVVGAHGMSGPARLIFGSVAEGILRHADLSIVVVPHNWMPARPDAADLSGSGPIVCGVDLTLPATEAAIAGARLATLLKTDALLVHIVARLRVAERWRADAEISTRARLELARSQLDRVARNTGAYGRVQLRVETGDVPACLAEIAHASPHSMLVLGRALRVGGYAPPGSNAYRAMTLAHVPVMMHVTRD